MTRSIKSANLPKAKRKPANAQFVLTERDIKILSALASYRYLRTGQISRLLFPENTTLQSARRRLKYLYHNGYIGRIQPLVQIGSGDGEIAYYLEEAGRVLLEDDQLPNYSLKNSVKPAFLQHALAVSEFRVNLELALKEFPAISLHRIIADFELKTHTENAIGKRRHRLFDEVSDPISKRKITVHPDLLFILKSETATGQTFQRLYFAEIDRGTEGLRILRDKLTGYHLYKRESIFKKFGDFDNFRVLFQTNSQKRADHFNQIAADFVDHLDVWSTTDTEVLPDTVLASPIWRAGDQNTQSILKR